MPTSSSRRARPRGLLAPFDPWKSPLCTCPFKLSLNPYTGCSFKCVYCYATAYIGLRDSEPKKDFKRRLARDLARWPPPTLVNIGTSSDPYPPIERFYGLTRSALEELLPRGYRVLVTTKGTQARPRPAGLGQRRRHPHSHNPRQGAGRAPRARGPGARRPLGGHEEGRAGGCTRGGQDRPGYTWLQR